MLFRSVAKCSAYGTNAMHCTSYHEYTILKLLKNLLVLCHGEYYILSKTLSNS